MFQLVSLLLLQQLSLSHNVYGALICEEIVDEGDCGSIPECYWEEEPACEEEITLSPSLIPSNQPSFDPSIAPTNRPSINPSNIPSDIPSVRPSLEPTGGSGDDSVENTPLNTKDWESITFVIDGPFNLSIVTEQDIIDTVETLDSLDGNDDLYNVEVNSLTEESATLTITYSPVLLETTSLSIDEIVKQVDDAVEDEYSNGSGLTKNDEKQSLLDDILENDLVLIIIGILLLIILALLCCIIWFCMCYCGNRNKRKNAQLSAVKKVELQQVNSIDQFGSMSSGDMSPVPPMGTNANTSDIMGTNNMISTDLIKAMSVSVDDYPTPMGFKSISPVTSGDDLDDEEMDGDVVNITGGNQNQNQNNASKIQSEARERGNTEFPALPQAAQEGANDSNQVNINDTAYAGGDLGESDSGDSSEETEIYGHNAAVNGVVNIGGVSKGGGSGNTVGKGQGQSKGHVQVQVQEGPNNKAPIEKALSDVDVNELYGRGSSAGNNNNNNNNVKGSVSKPAVYIDENNDKVGATRIGNVEFVATMGGDEEAHL